MTGKPKLSLIIPCYNEEQVINETVRRVTLVLREHFARYEIIFIDDGSTDHTLELLRSHADNDPQIKILAFSRNFGHQPAVSAGIFHCGGDIAVILDADLQDPPELIPEMVKTYQREQCNVVYAVRRSRQGEHFLKKFSAGLYYRLLNKLSDVPFPVDTGDFRLIDRHIICQFNQLQEKNKYIRGLISWMGYKQVPFYYDRQARQAGETKYPLSKMLAFAATGLLYFSKKPLDLAINLGFLCLLTGLLLTVYVVLGRLFDSGYAAGWASIMIAIIFFGGVQLLTVGITGRYIGNIFDEVKQRPEYIVAEQVNFETETTPG